MIPYGRILAPRAISDRKIRCRRFVSALGVGLALLVCGAPAAAKVVHFRVDPDATQIVASVDEPFVRVRGAASGSFTVLSGKIDGDSQDPVANGGVEIVLDASSYHSDDPQRDRRVTRDSLETVHYPTITFISTRIEDLKWEVPGSDATATVVGNLTLHGVTREIRVPVDAILSPDGKLSADGEVSFDFTAFGVVPPSALFGAIKAGSVVDLNFRVIAVPAERLPAAR
jgi:polyisoprenoid-binding protein YceI